MHTRLSNLLDKPEQMISSVISGFEAASGYPSEDVRLLAENKQIISRMIAELGLDPTDTTAEELHHALLAKYSSDSKLFDQAVLTDDAINMREKTKQAIQIMKGLYRDARVWTLKPTAAKKLLESNPPKKVMKAMSYRSVNSMIKRESIAELYLISSMLETTVWCQNLHKKAMSLDTNNWRLSEIQYIQLSEDIVYGNNDLRDFTLLSKETGAICLGPSYSTKEMPVLGIVLLFLDAVQGLGVNFQPQHLASLHPVLIWWSKTLALISDHTNKIVSLNIIDAAKSHLTNSSFENRFLSHAQNSLWQDLTSRYQKYAYDMQPAESGDYDDASISDKAVLSGLPSNALLESTEI